MRLSPYPMVTGAFIDRPNRFVCHARLDDGSVVRAHVPNTGRMRELLLPGAAVRLAHCPAPGRKTDYSLLTVRFQGVWVSVHAALANAVAFDYLSARDGTAALKREVVRGDSRFDLAGKFDGTTGYYEVKSVNLVVERDGRRLACFPDAPTTRGCKHLRGLLELKAQGYACGVIFVTQREDCEGLIPNWDTDPEFAHLLAECVGEGLDVRALRCQVTEGEICVLDEIPVMVSLDRDKNKKI